LGKEGIVAIAMEEAFLKLDDLQMQAGAHTMSLS
jgi:hypothetical protein